MRTVLGERDRGATGGRSHLSLWYGMFYAYDPCTEVVSVLTSLG